MDVLSIIPASDSALELLEEAMSNHVCTEDGAVHYAFRGWQLAHVFPTFVYPMDEAGQIADGFAEVLYVLRVTSAAITAYPLLRPGTTFEHAVALFKSVKTARRWRPDNVDFFFRATDPEINVLMTSELNRQIRRTTDIIVRGRSIPSSKSDTGVTEFSTRIIGEVATFHIPPRQAVSGLTPSTAPRLIFNM